MPELAAVFAVVGAFAWAAAAAHHRASLALLADIRDSLDDVLDQIRDLEELQAGLHRGPVMPESPLDAAWERWKEAGRG